MGACVTEKERKAAAKKLLLMNQTISALADTIADAASYASEADEKGLALSCHMLRESLLSYAKAVNRYAARVLKKDLDP